LRSERAGLARRPPAMTIHAADLALLDFRGETGKPDLPTSQRHDAGRLRADVVELQNAQIELTAVDAT
jgi:hypothetical protein